jgi:hypothetical protein
MGASKNNSYAITELSWKSPNSEIPKELKKSLKQQFLAAQLKKHF